MTTNARHCVTCGIRCLSLQGNVCSYACRMARDNGITRERAIRLFGEYENFTVKSERPTKRGRLKGIAIIGRITPSPRKTL